MKKFLTCLALSLLTTLSLQAQDFGGRRTLFLTAGANNSKLSGDGNDEAECLLALFFGADVNFCNHGPLLFSSGLNYTSSGSKSEFGNDGGEGGNYSIETKNMLSYLNIPVEARYEFGVGKIKPFVRGGGTFGLLLSAKSKSKTTINGQENESETDVKKQTKSTNLGLNLGGVSFPLGKYRGVASVRYLIGLKNVVKDDRLPSAKTRDVSVSVGIGLPIL